MPFDRGPMVYVVTVVHNRRPTTVQFASQLAAQTTQNITLVLVDDGSSDGTSGAVGQVFPRTIILKGDGHLWWGGGLQKGLNWLFAQNLRDDSIVAFTNDDVGFGENYFERATEELQSLGPRSFLVVPGVFQPSGRISLECGVVDWPNYRYRPFGNHPERTNFASTRSLFMRWGDLRTVGGFHPTLLPHYTSDFEFTVRAHRRGIRLVPSQRVSATFYDETTGDHSTQGLRLQDRLRLLASTRFSFNPIHHFMFIWYAAPWFWKVPCWVRVLWSTFKFLK